mmetsp:Transcript_81136/g.148371  ORF Transcript_81136/g.148371 Transcript_81136/m.148371 type:complete len:232 (+) Transcript_81136:261-956(+)
MHAHGLSTSTRSCDCFGAVGGGRASMVPVVIFAVLHLVSVWNSGLTDGGGGGGGGGTGDCVGGVGRGRATVIPVVILILLHLASAWKFALRRQHFVSGRERATEMAMARLQARFIFVLLLPIPTASSNVVVSLTEYSLNIRHCGVPVALSTTSKAERRSLGQLPGSSSCPTFSCRGAKARFTHPRASCIRLAAFWKISAPGSSQTTPYTVMPLHGNSYTRSSRPSIRHANL